MSLVTVCVIGNPPQSNWIVEINGLVYSQKTSFKARFTEFMEAEGGLHISLPHTSSPFQITVGTTRPPMTQITQYLKVLNEMGHKVVAATSHCSTCSVHNLTYIWTLA